MTISKNKQDTYTCPRCHDVVPMDGTMDLYDVVMQHDAKCTNPPRHVPAIYEAESGQMVDPKTAHAVVEWARRRGLVPELNHVCLYHGRPWVQIDGWYYLFRHAYSDGVVNTRALTRVEREDAKVEPDIHAWVAYAYSTPGGNLLAMGYGYARSGEEPLAGKKSPKALAKMTDKEKQDYVAGLQLTPEVRYPWRIAEKRAEEDALRKAIPLELNGEVSNAKTE